MLNRYGRKVYYDNVGYAYINNKRDLSFEEFMDFRLENASVIYKQYLRRRRLPNIGTTFLSICGSVSKELRLISLSEHYQGCFSLCSVKDPDERYGSSQSDWWHNLKILDEPDNKDLVKIYLNNYDYWKSIEGKIYE